MRYIPDIMGWIAAVALLVRCVCVVNRFKPSTWRKSPHFNIAVLGLTISSGLSAFAVFYNADILHLGFALMVAFAALVCFLDTRNNWSERKHWRPPEARTEHHEATEFVALDQQ